MKKLMTFCMAMVLVTTVSAQWGKRVKGNGNFVVQERNTGDYDAIAVAGWFDVNLVEGSEGNLTLEGEENLLEYIKTEVKDGKLIVKVKKGVNLKPSTWKEAIVVTVPVEEVNAVTLSGSGDIVSKTTLKAKNFRTSISGSGDIVLDIEADDVKATMSGSGDITLSGTATDFYAQVSGSGDIKAYGLTSEYVEAQVSGSADVKVTANQTLKARVSGSGDVHYRGNPKKVDSKTSGSGDITKG